MAVGGVRGTQSFRPIVDRREDTFNIMNWVEQMSMK